MTSTTLDRKFRALGYFLERAPAGARRDGRWLVRNLWSGSVAWDCATIAEAAGLLKAVQEREAKGGRARATVYWDPKNARWACADKPSEATWEMWGLPRP